MLNGSAQEGTSAHSIEIAVISATCDAGTIDGGTDDDSGLTTTNLNRCALPATPMPEFCRRDHIG
jgi:hypothetical protein